MSESNGSTKGNAPDKATGTAARCPACGETYGAADSHVCSDGPTAGVIDLNEPSAPPPSYFGIPPGETDPLVGTTLADRYLILSRVSQGGMGVVYKARHKLLNSIVAVKILLKQEEEIDQRRFLLEAQLASKLSHPNIVYISDFGLLPDGRPYLVMEYIEGPTLSRILRKSKGYRIDMLRACKIAVQIARGMQIVHDKGIVHRDLKPENIFVLDHAQAATPATTESGPVVTGKKSEDFVKIVDFGIAKDTGAAASTDPDAAMPAQMPRVPTAEELASAMRPIERGQDLAALIASSNNNNNNNSNGTESSQQSLPDPGDITGGTSGGISGSTSGGTSGTKEGLTQIGASIGTPRYMAPEQVDGVGIEARSDQYALGCILYQMIGGQVPFSGGSSMALLSMHMFEKPKSLRERYPELNVPESLDALVLRMLAKSKMARFASMSEVAAALEREIEVLSIQRGEKVAMSSGLAALLGGRRGTHIIIRGVKLPLFAVAAVTLAVVGILSLGGVLIFRRWLAEPTTLKPGELAELEERARQVLLNDLSAPGIELRQSALMGLAQTHDGRYRERLEASLRESSPQLQGQAAEALGQLGDRQAVPALQALLKASPALQVQLAAAQALSLLGDAQGQKFLESTLAGPSEEGRLRAASLLCQRGNSKALELLAQAVEKGVVPEPLSLNFLTCLTRAGNDSARQKLREQMQRGSGQAAMLAAAKLAQLGQEDGRAFLRERIRQPGPEQLVAARFLSAPDEPQVAELFRQVLRDRRSGAPARLLAAEGLGLSGQLVDARLLSGQLEPSREANVQLGAAASIVLLARNEPGALSEQSMLWARGALADSQWAIRESAVAVIGDSTAADAVPLLAKLTKDAHPAVRQSAVRALGRRREEDALLALRDALRDAEPTVRQESLRSLLRLSQSLPQASKQRQTLSANVDGWVKDLAAKGTESEQTLARALLFKLGDRSQLDALRELTKSTSADIRRLVIEQLGRELELLLSMLKDTVFAVRFGAARQLAEAGDKRAVPVLREAVERKGTEALLALALLRKLGETAPIPDGLVDTVSGGTLAERMAALETANELPADAALALLRRLARDVSAQVRQRVAEVASELPKQEGEESPPGVPILRLLTTDSDAAVRARASTLLAPFLAADKKPEAAAPAVPGTEDLAAPKAVENTKEPKAEGAAPTANPEPAKLDAGATAAAGAQGSGSLVVEAAPLVTFQLDRGRWQPASKQAIAVSAGSHELASLSGVQTVEVGDGKTVTVKIPESQIEKLTSGGLDAHEKKDLRKAQKLLEKANSLCSRERKHPQPCSELAIEINYHLGQIHEAGERLTEAMTAYQKVVSGAAAVRGHEQQRTAAQGAIARMLPSVGQVVIPKKVKNKCQEVTLYMLPGTHMIEIDGDSQTVKVKAQETVRLGSCSE